MGTEDETVHLVVRKPLADIESEIRRKHGVTSPLIEVAVERDSLVLTFQGGSAMEGPAHVPRTPTSKVSGSTISVASPTRRRAKRRVRNRMRTRGWPVVSKFVNGRGQSCTVYKPILDALQSRRLRRREAYTAVRQLLVANGNTPGPSSVEYFLDNHLEFMEKNRQAEAKGG
jgi:hypothetical protein